MCLLKWKLVLDFPCSCLVSFPVYCYRSSCLLITYFHWVFYTNFSVPYKAWKWRLSSESSYSRSYEWLALKRPISNLCCPCAVKTFRSRVTRHQFSAYLDKILKVGRYGSQTLQVNRASSSETNRQFDSASDNKKRSNWACAVEVTLLYVETGHHSTGCRLHSQGGLLTEGLGSINKARWRHRPSGNETRK
jgi:hypothetical protein